SDGPAAGSRRLSSLDAPTGSQVNAMTSSIPLREAGHLTRCHRLLRGPGQPYCCESVLQPAGARLPFFLDGVHELLRLASVRVGRHDGHELPAVRTAYLDRVRFP